MQLNSVSSLMKNYFISNGETSLLREGLPRDVPIKAKKVEWRATQDGSALIRTYEFENSKHLKSFIDQILAMQERNDHHAQILIEQLKVKVRVGTHTLNRITELDTEYAAQADHIFDETKESYEL